MILQYIKWLTNVNILIYNGFENFADQNFYKILKQKKHKVVEEPNIYTSNIYT